MCCIFFWIPFLYIDNLASASSGCQFVYTGEEAYGQEAACVCWVFGGCLFGEGFCL